MQFKNARGEIIKPSVEGIEQMHASKYTRPDAVVLELGARFGSVSCAINKNLANPTNQVSVEPDERVHEALSNNRASNGCKFHILNGVISRAPVRLEELNCSDGYGTTSVVCFDGTGNVPRYTLEEVEATYNLKFDCLVADCEGFLGQFFDENPHMYQQLKMVMFEVDYEHKCDYRKIMKNLVVSGFKQLEAACNNYHQVWSKY
jgi:FkbM family methyltransferase